MEEQQEMRLSASLEDYLKEILILSEDTEDIRVTDIARDMGISKPSVNRAMGHLKELGLIMHEHYGTIKLTENGVAAAKNVIETYKIAYKFLRDTLEVDEATAQAEAHMMEHILSKGTRKKLKKLSKKKK